MARAFDPELTSHVVSVRLPAPTTDTLRAVAAALDIRLNAVMADLLEVAIGQPPRDPGRHRQIRACLKRLAG